MTSTAAAASIRPTTAPSELDGVYRKIIWRLIPFLMLLWVLAWIDRVKPRRAILTHMNHTVDYETWKAKLPPGVEPAYDGLEVEVPDIVRS